MGNRPGLLRRFSGSYIACASVRRGALHFGGCLALPADAQSSLFFSRTNCTHWESYESAAAPDISEVEQIEL